MTAAGMRPSRAAHTVPPSLLLRSRREHDRDRLRIERLAALVEVALLGQLPRSPAGSTPPPFGFLRASRFASATTSGRVSAWLLRPRPSRQSPCACASAPLQAWPQGSSSRTQRPRPTPDAPARRSVCPRQSGWATGGAAMPPHGVAVQVAGVWAGAAGPLRTAVRGGSIWLSPRPFVASGPWRRLRQRWLRG
jgi:hypothetical protein